MTFRVPNGAIGAASWNFSAAIEEDKLTSMYDYCGIKDTNCLRDLF
jgi:hypothetical protein